MHTCIDCLHVFRTALVGHYTRGQAHAHVHVHAHVVHVHVGAKHLALRWRMSVAEADAYLLWPEGATALV